MLQQHEYQLFADYFKFYVEDENPEDTTENIWDDKKIIERGLAIGRGTIAVGTERNFTVPVSLEIHDSAPNDEFSKWDKVNECSIEISSGTIVISRRTDYRPDAARITVTPQCYRARIYYVGLDTVNDFDKGDDHYKVVLWDAPYADVKVLKGKNKKE